MADTAIGMRALEGGTVVAVINGIGPVLVLVVAEVIRRRAGFVLAIDGDRSPTLLERHEHQEENREPAAHWRRL